ncbi:TPA: hypothetical protein ACF50G_001752 [Staphylococcus aureus]
MKQQETAHINELTPLIHHEKMHGTTRFTIKIILKQRRINI